MGWLKMQKLEYLEKLFYEKEFLTYTSDDTFWEVIILQRKYL